MKKNLTFIFITYIFLIYPTATFAQSTNVKNKQMSACMAMVKPSAMYALDIPSGNNAILNKFIMALADIGDSPNTKTLVDLLSKPLEKPIAVVGEDEAVAAATIEAALAKIAAGDQQFANTICFAGNEKYADSLKMAAKKAGVTMLLPQP
ncbi:hypothetical protein HUU62_03245 [Rhodoferax sp. 4810]|nr:hypothetical protein [Rhodoferax jenense]